MNNFVTTVEKALATNLEGYQKARKAFARDYALSRSACMSATDSAWSASKLAMSVHPTVDHADLVRWATRCERAYLENFHNSIFEDSPTVAVIKCLD